MTLIRMVWLLATCCVFAQTLQATQHSLIKNSPFLPPSFKQQANKPANKPAQPKGGQFALKGISKIGVNYFFSIHDIRTKQSKWIKAGETTNGFTVNSYDPKTNTIEYTWNNQTYSLKLTASSDEPIPLNYLSSEGDATQARNQAAERNSRTVAQSRRIDSTREARSATSRIYSNTTDKVFFNRENSYTSSGRSVDTSNSLTSGNDLFAATDIPQDPSLEITADPGPTRRYGVRRINKVENPNGHRPDHLK